MARIPLRLPCCVLILLLLTLLSSSLGAQGSEDLIDELILLLEVGDGNPTPEEVIAAINAHGPAPGGLDVGDPTAARFAITERSQGRARELIEREPDTPEGRLERSIVLTYPSPIEIDSILDTLSVNPHVERVEKNLFFTLSAVPSDPFFPPTPSVRDYQWALHLLNLPEAWDLTKGHGYVGLIDTGVEIRHPDLRAFHREAGNILVYDGGNHRGHLSYDFRNDDCNVDERDPENELRRLVGHGTHVSGIVGATTDNGFGVAGACWHCSLLMAKAFPTGEQDLQTTMDKAGNALRFLVGNGASVLSMSFGAAEVSCSGEPATFFFCDALALAAQRDIVLAAASGNDKTVIEFPASDPRALAVGGIESDADSPLGFALWDNAPTCPSTIDPTRYTGDQECGSNFGPEQDLVAPASQVLSTVYTGRDHNITLACGDSILNPFGDGFGLCTGTSMATPYVAAVAGLVRSVNPVLSRDDITDLLLSSASFANRHAELGFGVPDSQIAVQRALGKARGVVLPNRLTPLFSLYSAAAQTHAYTTFPSAATAFLFAPFEPFSSVGPAVPGYPAFPGAACAVSPCTTLPGASVYIFTTDRPPFPDAPPLKPLYRMRYDPNLPNRCVEPPVARIANHDFAYTTEVAGILRFADEITDANGVGYELDGIEGYIFERCSPEPACIPEGAVKLYRLYNPLRDDYAIFPESELAQKLSEGYISQPNLSDVLGYVYPNVDSDGDTLIDGFEIILGTDPNELDTDCDGLGDGQEILVFDRSASNPRDHSYGDPLQGPCIDIFADGFESGDFSAWSEIQF